MTDRALNSASATRVEEWPDILREWRVGTHVVTDESGRETGELVDEEKSYRQLMEERVEAASAIEKLIAVRDAAMVVVNEWIERGDGRVQVTTERALRDALYHLAASEGRTHI